VPHANRALRAFNMYLNMRKPLLQSQFYLYPISFLFPRPELVESPGSSSRATSPTPETRHSQRSTLVPISPIPPASNPRGELIFSSRVDKNFRESYERYRAAFERRREERERQQRASSSWWRWWPFQTKLTPYAHARSISMSSNRMSRSETPSPSATAIRSQERSRSPHSKLRHRVATGHR
jgi:hypothetical protein